MRKTLQRKSLATFVAVIAISLFASTTMAQTPQLFVETFNKLTKAGEVAVGVNYRIEGRLSSIAPNLLKLQKCPQLFRPIAGETFGKSPDNRTVVEVFGQLKKQGQKTIFVVSTLRFLRDDADMFALKKNGVRGGKPDDWYKLAAWSGRRATFYGDKLLQQRADEANRKGIGVERNLLPVVDAAALLTLATKVDDLKLPESTRLEFVHEAHRLTWDSLTKQKQPDIDSLLASVKKLPGATERLPTPQPELEKKYRDRPLPVYLQAGEKTRRKLHRIFYGDVLLASIQRAANRKGSDGFVIADLIDNALPERHELAELQRERELKERLAHVDRLTRPEMLDLADRFRRKKQPDKASETVANWLKATEDQLRAEGPVGLMRAAEEYIDLLEDEEKAIKLLKEAYKLSPESERISERLTQLEYRLQDGEWIPAKLVKQRLETPIQKAIRVGRVIEGMTAVQVRRTLGAATSVTRIATSGQVSELWIYGEPSGSRITVHLLRRTPRSPLTAVRIAQVSP